MPVCSEIRSHTSSQGSTEEGGGQHGGRQRAARLGLKQASPPTHVPFCAVLCSAVRDAAIECLEEVFKVYGEQLMDVLSSHQLRPAHLNLIYSRLAQLGAQVEPTPEQSCEGNQF